MSLSRELPLLFVPLLRLYPVPRRCALRLTPAQTIAEWARQYSRDRSENLYRISCRHREQGAQIFELSPVGSSHVPPPITNLERSDAWTICTRFFAVKRTSVLLRAF